MSDLYKTEKKNLNYKSHINLKLLFNYYYKYISNFYFF